MGAVEGHSPACLPCAHGLLFLRRASWGYVIHICRSDSPSSGPACMPPGPCRWPAVGGWQGRGSLSHSMKAELPSPRPADTPAGQISGCSWNIPASACAVPLLGTPPREVPHPHLLSPPLCSPWPRRCRFKGDITRLRKAGGTRGSWRFWSTRGL